MMWARSLIIIASVAASANVAQSQSQNSFNGASLQNGFAKSEITFGPAVPVRVYSTREAAKWAFDFIASPSRARDRVLIYSYKLDADSTDLIKKILDDDANPSNDVQIAIVSKLNYGPLPMLGGDKGYYAVPILSISSTLMDNPVFDRYSALSPELASKVVGIAALKSVGIELPSINDTTWIQSDVSAYLAVNKPVAGRTPDQYFIIGQSAWEVPENEPNLIWGLTVPSK